mmetsp:Transcript_72943/g.146836  ORF Transcript_72943/g.146836 Transcript_72943/m.146836 type:complete len:283 (-) Transcript_72943:351-1199(-)
MVVALFLVAGARRVGQEAAAAAAAALSLASHLHQYLLRGRMALPQPLAQPFHRQRCECQRVQQLLPTPPPWPLRRTRSLRVSRTLSLLEVRTAAATMRGPTAAVMRRPTAVTALAEVVAVVALMEKKKVQVGSKEAFLGVIKERETKAAVNGTERGLGATEKRGEVQRVDQVLTQIVVLSPFLGASRIMLLVYQLKVKAEEKGTGEDLAVRGTEVEKGRGPQQIVKGAEEKETGEGLKVRGTKVEKEKGPRPLTQGAQGVEGTGEMEMAGHLGVQEAGEKEE